MRIKQRQEIFCIDCNAHRQQNFKCSMPDHTLLYQCEKCGCENSLPIEEDEKEEENTSKQ